MININLYDSCFPGDPSQTSGQTPLHINYIRENMDDNNYSLYTHYDMYTQSVTNPRKAFGWLFESIEVMPEAFLLIPQILNKFEKIFTYYEPFIKWRPDKFWWAPAMGSWIGGKPDGLGGGTYGITDKSKMLSMICSPKVHTRGHQLRRNVADNIKNCDVFGLKERFHQTYDVIAPYRFSVVIENGMQPGYFTEKLLNCLAVGTIPIYWGCINLKNYGFDEQGIISLSDFLSGKVKLSENLYEILLPHAKNNYKIAIEYKCPEDYIYTRYLKGYTFV